MPITQSGQVWPYYSGDPTGRLKPQDSLTAVPSALYNPVPYSGSSPDAIGSTDVTPTTDYRWYLLGIVLLLITLKFASEHERSGIDPHFVGVGLWNFIAVGIMSLLFIVSAKVIFNKYHIKGLTDIVTIA